MKCLALSTVLALTTLLGYAGAGHAQSDFPNKSIQMILGFAPGGVTDLFSRILSSQLSEQLGVSVVVQNKPGANGNIGAELTAKSPADGYTLYFNTGSVLLNPLLETKHKFVDSFTELTPVALAGYTPFVLVITPPLPANNIREFIAYAKANPGKMSYGSGGVGNATHIANLLFQQSSNITATHVPFKGGGPSMAATISQEVQFCMDTVNAAASYIKSNRVRGLAVTSLKRIAALPDIPTFHETVLPGFEVGSWYGVMAPAKTPANIIRRLNAEISKALQDPRMLAKLAESSVEPNRSTPEQYGAFLKSEYERWEKLIKTSGITVD